MYTDILFSYDTDIDFANEDIMIVSDIEMIKRQIFKLLITDKNDWKFEPNTGATPNRFIGEQNTRETAQLLKQYMETNINNLMHYGFVDIKIIPLNYESVKIYIDVYLDDMSKATMPFTLDFVNGLIYTQFDNMVDTLVSNKNIKINSVDDIPTPNIYKDRLRLQSLR